VLNLVGSLLLNVLGAALQVFTGPPQLPAGSTVTVRTSSLTLPDTGQTVVADWYFPNNGDTPTRLIYLQHGFLADAAMYSYTAAYLAQQTDSIVVAPTLPSNFLDPSGDWLGGTPEQQAVADLFVGNRDALTESASAAAGHPVALPTRFVLMGHSLGGALVTAAAGDMVDNGAINDLAGVVLLDSVDLNNAVPIALQKLTGANDVPIEDISSVPYVWNVDGIVGQELEAARPGQFDGVMLVNGHHIDALQGGNALIQLGEYLVAGPSELQNVDAVKLIAAGWVNDLFAGTHTGVYGAPQQTIQIPTAGGTATAVVLPFTSTKPVQVTPWDGIAQLILNVALSQAVYTPLA
jgi:pimeloyl-ACP methyl ester carboxylesterase